MAFGNTSEIVLVVKSTVANAAIVSKDVLMVSRYILTPVKTVESVLAQVMVTAVPVFCKRVICGAGILYLFSNAPASPLVPTGNGLDTLL